MPFVQVTPVYEPAVRGLCVKPYPLHPTGCPNFHKKAGCPPAAPQLPKAFDLDGPCFLVFNVFDFGAHVAKMRAAHPGWSDRQVSCCLSRFRRAEEAAAPAAPRVCPGCGASHAAADRQARLARLLPATREALQEGLPCLYGGAAGERRMYRDLRAIGAVQTAEGWALPARQHQVEQEGAAA